MTGPQVFGKYQLVKKLATGGMAEVWLARETGIEGFSRHVVVKKILPHLADDPEFVQMFLNEAKLAARLSHSNIVQIYDFGKQDDTYFIAMEFIRGEDLGRVMRKAWSSGQWIARPLSTRIVASACEGLYYAHSKTDDSGRPLRIVHRDISPQNILISFDGTVKLVDFGIAKAADQHSMTRSGAIKGKFAYMSPEQAAGKPLDHRSDIFAIGLVLYELLTGVRPLKRDSEIATLQAALECAIEPPSAVADVPAELDPVVMKALAKAADDRYRDARALQMALEEFLVSQRWVASSVQISELMETLFADRIAEEKKSGLPAPVGQDSAPSGTPVAPLPPSQVGRKEISWDAPPGQSDAGRDGRRGRGFAKASYRREPSTVPTDPGVGGGPEVTGDSPSWDAPPSNEVPGPRRTMDEVPQRKSGHEPTAIGRTPSRETLETRETRSRSSPALARSPSRPSMIRADARPSRRETGDEDSLPPLSSTQLPQADQVPRRRSRPSSPSMASRPSRPELATPVRADVDPDDLVSTEDREPAPRRKSGAHAFVDGKRTGSLKETFDRPEREDRPDRSELSLDRVVDLEELKRQSRERLRLVFIGAGLCALALLVFVFREPILDVLSHKAIDGQSIKLTVISNPKARVYVRHARHEDAPEPETYLGETPLKAVKGAHVRDTIVLTNPDVGLHYEEEIKFGQPNETKKIEKNFEEGYLMPRVLQKGVTGLSFWRENRRIGDYTPGMKITLYEGKHRLEVRGAQLKAPVPFEVEIKRNAIVEKELDLSGQL